MKIALGIESSNSRGMGHLFRSLLYVKYLENHNIEYVYLINQNKEAEEILMTHGIEPVIADYEDTKSNWETELICKCGIDIWLNDKFETTQEMASHIKQNKNVLLCMIDDVGEGEQLCDVYFAGMIAPSKNTFASKEVYTGSEYIVLNDEIKNYSYKRKELHKIIVSLGGSDPHCVTYDIMRFFSDAGYRFTVDYIVGPSYREKEDLERLNAGKAVIMQNVPSLIETFSHYDLAVTGGGVTCCEACAAGLPVIIIANAPHEINTGKYIESLGCGIFAGDFNQIDYSVFENIDKYNLGEMSEKGMHVFDTYAVERIFDKILRYRAWPEIDKTVGGGEG